MYIKNRRDSNKFKALGSYQTLYLTESFVLRNRLLFIYQTLMLEYIEKPSNFKSKHKKIIVSRLKKTRQNKAKGIAKA